jgi:transposase
LTVQKQGEEVGVLDANVWRAVFGVDRDTVIEGMEFEPDSETVVVHVRPRRSYKPRCGRCGVVAPGYDQGAGRRTWRALDLGTIRCVFEADAPRVRCRSHGPTVAQVPWARHDTGHTRAFDDTVAWLVLQCSKTAVTEFMRVAWRTVGAILTRVGADIDATVDRLEGLRRIGIDEISYKRGHRYMTVVVCHDTRRLVWARAGRDEKTISAFFDELGERRSAEITHVSADSAKWISTVVEARCKNAVLCADPFHVVSWATNALDTVRRQVWNQASGRRHKDPETGRPSVSRGNAARIRRARYALWKNPENLTAHQKAAIDWIAKTDPTLYRAYLLKEGLRTVFALKGDDGKEALEKWIDWARRCRIPAFVELEQKVTRNRASIEAALDHGLSQGLIESTNTKIRLLTRVAFGFHSAQALIALAMLALGGQRPVLPRRSPTGSTHR